MARTVLDSSAVIAVIRGEPGSDVAAVELDQAVVSAVNIQEIAKWLWQSGFDAEGVREVLDTLNLDVRVHDGEDAFLAAALVRQTSRHGAGLGDRSCIALAIRLGLPVLTTDRSWAKLDIPGLEIRLLR